MHCRKRYIQKNIYSVIFGIEKLGEDGLGLTLLAVLIRVRLLIPACLAGITVGRSMDGWLGIFTSVGVLHIAPGDVDHSVTNMKF